MNKRKVLIAIIAGGLGLLGTIAVTAGVVAALTSTNIRDTQESGSPVIKALAAQADEIEAAVNASTELNEAILPCFDPTSDCAKEAAAAEAARAGANLTAIIAATYCADQVLDDRYTLSELTACVGRRIKTEGTEP